jgi:hypothetical protein
MDELALINCSAKDIFFASEDSQKRIASAKDIAPLASTETLHLPFSESDSTLTRYKSSASGKRPILIFQRLNPKWRNIFYVLNLFSIVPPSILNKGISLGSATLTPALNVNAKYCHIGNRFFLRKQIK